MRITVPYVTLHVPCHCMRDSVITILLEILWRVTNIVSHYHQKQAQWTLKHVKSQDTEILFIISLFLQL